MESRFKSSRSRDSRERVSGEKPVTSATSCDKMAWAGAATAGRQHPFSSRTGIHQPGVGVPEGEIRLHHPV